MAAVDALAVVCADAGKIVGARPGVLQAAGLRDIRCEVQPLQKGHALRPAAWRDAHEPQRQSPRKLSACLVQLAKPRQLWGLDMATTAPSKEHLPIRRIPSMISAVHIAHCASVCGQGVLMWIRFQPVLGHDRV